MSRATVLSRRALANLSAWHSQSSQRCSRSAESLWNGFEVCTGSQSKLSPANSKLVARSLASAAASTPTPEQEQASSVQPSTSFVYEGPLSTAVRRLKTLSLFSCAATVAGAPVLVFFGPDASSLTAKASIAFTLCSFGVFSTGLLHWFTGPYVHRLSHEKQSSSVEVTSLSILAKPIRRSLRFDQMKIPDTLRPQATFEVDGNIFYVDGDNFADKELLAKISKVGEPL